MSRRSHYRTRGKERPSSRRLRSFRDTLDSWNTARQYSYNELGRFYENRRESNQTDDVRSSRSQLRARRRPFQVSYEKADVVYRPWSKTRLYSASEQALFTEKQNDPTICDRRQTRKEVIHATGNGGRRGQKAAVWRRESYIKCRRK